MTTRQSAWICLLLFGTDLPGIETWRNGSYS